MHISSLNICPSSAASAYCPSGQLGLRERSEWGGNTDLIAFSDWACCDLVRRLCDYWCLNSQPQSGFISRVTIKIAGCSRFEILIILAAAVLFYPILFQIYVGHLKKKGGIPCFNVYTFVLHCSGKKRCTQASSNSDPSFFKNWYKIIFLALRPVCPRIHRAPQATALGRLYFIKSLLH